MTPSAALILAVTVIVISVIGWAIYMIATAKKREIKRVSGFIDEWEKSAQSAIQLYKSFQDPDRFFSDKDREDWIRANRGIKSAFESFKEPKDPEQNNRLELFRSFLNCYNTIGIAQIDNNVAYFNKRTADLPEAYGMIHDTSRFVGHHEVEDFKSKWTDIISQFGTLEKPEVYNRIVSFPILQEVSNLLSSKKDKLQKQRLSDNAIYSQNELIQQKDYFDTIFKYPLDEQQRKAVITMEDNTLVVSSAGSGKTSTIVGKVRYLVNQKNVDPSEILVLTYTRKAAAELRERMGIDGITSSTFHKHAMETMGMLTGSRPTIADDSILLNIFEDLISNDKDFLAAFNKYVTEQTNLAKDDHEYESAKKHASDMQKYGLRSPYKDGAGQRKIMKSKQEVQISVILTHLGVDFRYEEPYCIDTSTSSRRKYKPDFVIHYRVKQLDAQGREVVVEKILYYEHFGIDAQGHVPIWFGDGLEGGWQKAQQNYTDGMEWKRSLHATNNTDLMETTSADFSRHADMESYIEQLLHKHGVPTRHLTEEEKRARLLDANSRVDSSLFSLIQGFITLMKANKKTLDEIIGSIQKGQENADRNIAVLNNIIRPIYDRYQKTLSDSGELDFTDVLLETAELCEERNPYNYKFILVDEFQDISMDKYIYLKSLRKSQPYTTLFCVGDDWQSIYRFSGSDMTLFYDFAKFFGYTEECKIETTHRFGQPLLNASSVFILTNPEQKEKKVTTTQKENTNIKFLPYSGDNEAKIVESIVKEIPKNESIYILGRYRFNADSVGAQTRYRDPKEPIDITIGDRKIRYLTIHSSKGLEADHVIILDCESGTYGFPSLIADDPILEYVLSGADSFENAEERRVFYVGITRARKCTYCLFSQEDPSPFMTEFGEYSKYQGSTEAICPRCHRGYVRVVKTGTTKYGKPYVTANCTNTACDYFETVYDDAVYKYQPRVTIRTWKLRDFMTLAKTSHVFLDYNSRIYCLIKKPENNYIPLIIASNIVVNKLLWEDLNRNPSEYEVAAIKYYESHVFVLRKPLSEVFISNSDLENSIRFSKSIASRERWTIIEPNTLL